MFARKDKITQSLTEIGDSDSQQESTTKHSAKGVYGLKKCHDSPEAVADIVFVHGLTGNRETTWTDKSTGIFWPAHLLKTVIPKTRIVTFGYDADIAHFFSTASQNCIRNHANNLTNAVAQLRERTETEERPIIFVTHSLGGLVFEDAMVTSRNSPEAHLQKIYDSTAGVCFLGTPHCGSTLANWGTVFGQIANTVKRINTDLLRVLEPESEVLARIQEEFHKMLRSRTEQGRPQLPITCFYEELPVKGVGEIVPKHSAILPAYNSIGIYANHMDMARFADEEDPGFESVSGELLRWVKTIQKVNHPAKSSVGTSHAKPAASSSSPWSENSAGAQNLYSSPWAKEPTPYAETSTGPHSPWAKEPDPYPGALTGADPSSSPWAEEPAPYPGTSAAPPGFFHPQASQAPYQYPPGGSSRNPYYQRLGPMHAAQYAYGPPEWRRSSPQPEQHGGNHMSGKIEGNTGQILQGPFHGNLTFTNR
ncbi:hypothetical protein B0T14DRAFT_456077 [Immersiella caudata]|uniref:DUF676 domain-containing protein n=1 Tax=Immersiella caudata TaxID=314043 RepID=A0AA40BZM3_9PEZI|nr:hypothetical protein B0T14DRAFT_456077 [Immersiella caudata]